MDTEWFKNKLAEKRLSQRGLAKLVELDQAAISLMFRGKRRMTPHEAHQISQILGVPILEVMRRAGIDVTDDGRKAPVTSYMDAKGSVVQMPHWTHDSAISPGDCPLGTYAVQVRAHSSTRDGWLIFVNPTQNEARQHLDQMCVVATSTGKLLMGIVRKGYKAQAHNVILWPSEETIFDVDIAWVSPVLWIKPT